jgi:heme exporter protein C
MLIPLLVMAGAFKVYYFIVLLLRSRNELLEREQNGKWIDDLLEQAK